MRSKTYEYKYILFDWDGTLVKTLDVWFDAYKEIGEKHGIDFSGISDKELVEIFFGKLGKGYEKFGIKDTDKIFESVKEIVDEKVKTVTMYPNTDKALKMLGEMGIKMALHTTSNRNLLYPAISVLGIEKYFGIILTKDEIKNRKPDPEVILRELDFFKADPKDALIVGDSDSDIRAGNNAQVDTVLFYPPHNETFYRKEFLLATKPDYIISDLLQLIEIVK